MTDIFISYSRKDQDFARRLFDSLAKEELEAWVDWEGIPPTADWLIEIYKGIDEANTFAFIISPDSLASEICNLELEHAIKQNKRLVPIVCRDPERMEMHKQLSAHNWIFVNDDTFAEGVQTIVEAINLDLGYVRVHTRLLTRAGEWERLGRDNSYVLRGTDLVEAENWLAEETEDVSPQPTALQREYIVASRQYASKQQRNILFGVVAVLVVSVGLGFVAFSQWQLAGAERDNAVAQEATAVSEAEQRAIQEGIAVEAQGVAVEAQDVAEAALATQVVQAEIIQEQSKISKAQVLAAESKNIAKFDSQLSILLALYGAQVTADEGVILPEVQEALYNALDSKLQFNMIGSSGNEGLSVATDGSYAITVGSQGGLDIWNLKTGQMLDNFEVDVQSVIRQFNDVDVNPVNPNRIAASANAGVFIVDLETQEILDLLAFDFSSNYPTTTAYSPDGKYLAAGWELGSYISVWDGDSGVFLRDFDPGGNGSVRDLIFSEDSSLMAAGFANGNAAIFNPANGELLHLLKGHVAVNGTFIDDGVTGLAFSKDGSRLYTAGADGVLKIWDVESGSVLASILIGEGMLSVAISPDGTIFATGHIDGSMRVFSAASNAQLYEFKGHFNEVKDLEFDLTTGNLVSSSTDGTVKVWTTTDPSLLYQLDGDVGKRFELYLKDYSDSHDINSKSAQDVVSVGKVEFSTDGQYLMVFTNNSHRAHPGDMYAYAMDDLSARSVLPDEWLFFDAYKDGIIYKTADAGYIGYLSLEAGETTVKVAETGGWWARFSSNAKEDVLLAKIQIGIYQEVDIYVWSDEGEELYSRSFPYPDLPGGPIALNPAGDKFAYLFDGEIVIVDIASGEELQTFTAHTSAISDLEFSSDGLYLASSSQDGTAKIWLVDDDYSLLHTLQGHAGSVIDLEFDPLNQYIVTAGQDGVVKLWNLETGAAMRTIKDRESEIASITISPDGHLLAVAGDGDLVNIYSLDASDIIEQAVAKLNRGDLTAEECKRYLAADTCQLIWLDE